MNTEQITILKKLISLMSYSDAIAQILAKWPSLNTDELVNGLEVAQFEIMRG